MVIFKYYKKYFSRNQKKYESFFWKIIIEGISHKILKKKKRFQKLILLCELIHTDFFS